MHPLIRLYTSIHAMDQQELGGNTCHEKSTGRVTCHSSMYTMKAHTKKTMTKAWVSIVRLTRLIGY